jgi:hypothetical protein
VEIIAVSGRADPTGSHEFSPETVSVVQRVASDHGDEREEE